MDFVRAMRAYRGRGIFVDTNILLLLLVGSAGEQHIASCKRLNTFDVDDYRLLTSVLARFSKVVTTPNVLTEVNSFINQIGEPLRSHCMLAFGRGIDVLDERYTASNQLASDSHCEKLGLTDTGILITAKKRFLVLSDDFRLCGYLEKNGVHYVNFNHLRSESWGVS